MKVVVNGQWRRTLHDAKRMVYTGCLPMLNGKKYKTGTVQLAGSRVFVVQFASGAWPNERVVVIDPDHYSTADRGSFR